MSRGFTVVATVLSADELTPERVADEVAANGLLSAFEKTNLLPGALATAKQAIGYVGEGPFTVTLTGSDRTQEIGERTSLSVTVTSLAVTGPPVETPVESPVEVPVESPAETVIEGA